MTSATAFLALAGISYIVTLLIFPPRVAEESNWPIVDKRWLIASYLLAVALIYAPAIFGRLFDLWHRRDKPVAVPHYRSRPFLQRRGYWAAASVVGFSLSAASLAPYVQETLLRSQIIADEAVHLGSLQSVHNGRTPFIRAQTQYGPGHQIVSYALMRQTEFSLWGFRLSHLILNFLAEGIRFSILLIAFGWAEGAAAVALSLLFSPPWLLTYVGFGVIARWLGPMIVGSLLPLVIWTPDARRWRYRATAILGGFGGLLAWFSQENFSTVLATAGLIVAAAFARRRLSLSDSVGVMATFTLTHVAVFILALTALVGASGLSEALFLAFHGASIWVQGVANTYWADYGMGWTGAFYATPFIVVGVLALALYRNRVGNDESQLALLIGAAAAAASLVPITLMRSDPPHFVGPSIALPGLIVLSIVMLPGLMFGKPKPRELMRVAVCTLFFIAYGPSLLRQASAIIVPAALDRSNQRPASGFDPRLGFQPNLDSHCCTANEFTFRELRDIVEEVRAATASRLTLVDATSIAEPSIVYFLADLRVGTSMPEPYITMWLFADEERARRELAREPVDCLVVTSGVPGRFTADALATFKSYNTHSVHGVDIICKD